MVITEWFSIRSMTFSASWVALILAFICVWLIVRLKFSKSWSELYGDSIFTFLLVWKFSVIITDFSTVLKQPMAILYFNGGTIGFYLGIVVVMTQFWYKQKRMLLDEKGLMAIGWSIILTQSFYQCFMVLLNKNALWQEIITLTVSIILTLIVLWKMKESKLWKQQMLIIYTVVLAFITTIQPLGILQTAMGASVIFLLFWLILLRNKDVMVEGSE